MTRDEAVVAVPDRLLVAGARLRVGDHVAGDVVPSRPRPEQHRPDCHEAARAQHVPVYWPEFLHVTAAMPDIEHGRVFDISRAPTALRLLTAIFISTGRITVPLPAPASVTSSRVI